MSKVAKVITQVRNMKGVTPDGFPIYKYRTVRLSLLVILKLTTITREAIQAN